MYKIVVFDEKNLQKEINQFTKIFELLDKKSKLEKEKKQYKRDRIKRKIKSNEFKIIFGFPSGEEINENNNK